MHGGGYGSVVEVNAPRGFEQQWRIQESSKIFADFDPHLARSQR